jgi:hypothetical protein
MRIAILVLLIMAAVPTLYGETIATVKDEPSGYCCTLDDGTELHVPKDARNRHYKMVQDWKAKGGVVAVADSEQPAAKKADSIEKRIALQVRVLAIREEIAQAPDDKADLQALLDAVQAQLTDLRK